MFGAVKFPLFELLPESDRSQAFEKLKVHKYHSGQTLYYRGDNTDTFFISQGKVRCGSDGPHGDPAFIHYRGAGDMIGFYSAITRKPQIATATAMEDTVAGRMPAADFMDLVLSRRELSSYMLCMVTEMLRSETNRITHLIVMPAPLRVVAEILERTSAAGSNVIEIPERVELASRLGMTRETLARHLSDLQKKGLIAIERNRIHVLDPKQLYELLE